MGDSIEFDSPVWVIEILLLVCNVFVLIFICCSIAAQAAIAFEVRRLRRDVEFRFFAAAGVSQAARGGQAVHERTDLPSVPV